ncbi:aminotransferase class I/II-fold pyridoxal phosphate-dependent enzyme [Labrenzia sp. CE80]|uniref:aminotransferase class I/II-fold pyridoxal phosphate-dependent enzyme n=1 Tax=Labrenzia sp. CE80 TaxID=1788986 RepID=UPI00129AA632|nr:aminotransferase class I/II-fold pyridoxal phosphate-dependent enzyme [Labrenzia sp. CE80]
MTVNPHIEALPAYNAGLHVSRFEADYGQPPLAKLDSNETLFGTSPLAIEAGQSAVLRASLYPDGSATDLSSALAAHCDVDVDTIVFGNGSEELIYALYGAVLAPGDHVLTVVPGFGLHTLAAKCLQIPVRTVSYKGDWQLPISELTEKLTQKPKILAISSPSNPMGVALSIDELQDLISKIPPETLLLLDEAYFEYNPIATLAALKISGLNWVSLRTFSKAYGLAGARLGYGLCSNSEIRDGIRSITPPFNANSIAQAMAHSALSDKTHLENTIRQTSSARESLSDALREMKFEPAPSKSNAVFFETSENSRAVAEALRDVGILVKPWMEEGFERFLRVSVGRPQENDAFLSAIRKLGLKPGSFSTR